MFSSGPTASEEDKEQSKALSSIFSSAGQNQESRERARDAFDEMMQTRTKTAEEINEMIRVYFKQIDQGEQGNWDDFDDIVQQVNQYVMEHQCELQEFAERAFDVMDHFTRRAERFEFPTLRYIHYLLFACNVQGQETTIVGLLRHGCDVLYPLLQWPDKLQILDTVNRGNMSFKQIVFNKIAMDIMLADYTNLVCEMNLEGVIAMIAHIKTISTD